MGLVRYVFLFALGGCGLFPNLGGLSGSDASVEAGGSDVISQDVNAEGAPPTPTYCATQDATFCEDFDEPDGGYLDNWSTPSVGDGNTLATQTALVTSAPNALVVEVPAGNTGGASLWKDLPPNASEYDYSFSIRFEPYSAGSGYVLWGQIEVDNTGAFTEYRFSTYNGGTKFEAHVFYPDGGNTVAGSPLSTTFNAGQWYRVDEKLTVSPPPAKIQVMLNGIQVLQTTITQATDGPGTAEFLAGIYHTSGVTGTWRLEIDDVVMRVK